MVALTEFPQDVEYFNFHNLFASEHNTYDIRMLAYFSAYTTTHINEFLRFSNNPYEVFVPVCKYPEYAGMNLDS